MSLLLACTCSAITQALDILTNNVDECDLNELSEDNDTPLMVACWKGMTSVALALIESIDKIDLGVVNRYGETALHLTFRDWDENDPDYEYTKEEAKSVAMTILDNTDRFNLGKVTNGGNTALELAIYHNEPDVAMRILDYPKKCNLNNVNTGNYNALGLAVRYRFPQVAMKILNTPDLVNINQVDDQGGGTPLTYACCMGYTDVALKLLSLNDCECDTVDIFGMTPLMYAVHKSLRDVVLKILKRYTHEECNIYQANDEGETVVDLLENCEDDIIISAVRARFFNIGGG